MLRPLALAACLGLAGCGLFGGLRDGASADPGVSKPPPGESSGGYGVGYLLGSLAITAASLVTKGAINASVVKSLTAKDDAPKT